MATYHSELILVSQTMSTDTIITFNVGGQIHSTFRSTIMKFPETMLAKAISGEAGAIPLQKDANGVYFIDRSPVEFEQVMAYYRDEIVPNSHRIRMYWGFGDTELHPIEAAVSLRREKAFGAFDESYEASKRWVRAMITSMASDLTSILRGARVRTVELSQLEMSDDWLSSLTFNEQEKLIKMFNLRNPRPNADNAFDASCWHRRLQTIAVSQPQMVVISAILQQIGCKDVKWAELNGPRCLCGLSGKLGDEVRDMWIMDDIEENKCLVTLSVIATQTKVIHTRVPICRRTINYKVRTVVDAKDTSLPKCPDGSTTIHVLTFKFATCEDYQQRF